MSDVDKISKPKIDIDPTSSTRTGEDPKYTPEITRKTAFSAVSGRQKRQTPAQLLMLQRVVGNRATQKIIQRQMDIEDIPSEMAKWPKDLNSLISNYPAAEQMLSFYQKVPDNVTEKLTQAIVLHTNAAKITGLIAQAPETERAQWVDKIMSSKGVMGLIEGTIGQDEDAQMMAMMPDYATDYYQRVMNTVTAKWGGLSEENKKDLTEQVFNQAKGYDWAVIDIEKMETGFRASCQHRQYRQTSPARPDQH